MNWKKLKHLIPHWHIERVAKESWITKQTLINWCKWKTEPNEIKLLSVIDTLNKGWKIKWTNFEVKPVKEINLNDIE